MTVISARRLTSGERATARQQFTLMAEIFGEDTRPLADEYLDRLLTREDFWAIAAFAGDELVGGLTAHKLPMTSRESAEVFVYDLAVRADHRRRGIGRALLEALGTAAGRQGIRAVFVAVDQADTEALAFYRALGGAASPVTLFLFTPDTAGATRGHLPPAL